MTTMAYQTNRKDFRYLKCGLDVLAVYWILRFFLKPDGFNVENILLTMLLVFSIAALFIQIHVGRKRNQSCSRLDAISRVLFLFLVLVCSITWLRGISSSPKQLLTLFFNPIVGGTVWLLPMFVLIGTQKGVINALLPVFHRHASVSVVFSLVTLVLYQFGERDLAFSATKSAHLLLYPVQFVLLAGLGSKSYRRLFFGALLPVTLCHLLLENRLHFLVGVTVLLVYMTVGDAKSKPRIWLKAAVAMVCSFLVVIVLLQVVTFGVSETWQSDTRSFLFEELADDLSDMEFVVGRGALGGYFSRYFYTLEAEGIEGGDAAFRQVSEAGYLHIILKAGFIGVAAILLLKIRVLSLVRYLDNYRIGFGVTLVFLIHLLAMFIGYHLAFDPFQVFSYLLVGWVISEAKRNRVFIKR